MTHFQYFFLLAILVQIKFMGGRAAGIWTAIFALIAIYYGTQP